MAIVTISLSPEAAKTGLRIAGMELDVDLGDLLSRCVNACTLKQVALELQDVCFSKRDATMAPAEEAEAQTWEQAARLLCKVESFAADHNL